MKKHLKTLIIIFIILFCSTSFSQRHYTVKAINGLIIRVSPTSNSKRLGKLPYGYHFEVDEISVDRSDTITDQGYKIIGNWVPVKNDTINGYVFDGFTKRSYDTNYYRLYGPVKSLKTYYYYADNKEKIKYNEHAHFNKLGKKTQVYEYDKGWELDEEYIYNKKNLLISRYQYNTLYKYKYDKKGNEIERIQFDEDKTPETKTSKTYDKKGNKTSSEYYNYKKKTTDKSYYSYNNANKRTKATHNYNDGKSKVMYLYEYLNDTILAKEYRIDYEENKKLNGERIITDSLGFISEKYVEYNLKDKPFNKSNVFTSEEKMFDPKHKLIKKITYASADSQLPSFSFSGGSGSYNERTVKEYQNGELTSVKLYKEIYYKQEYQELLIEDISRKPNYSNEIYHTYYSDFKEISRNEYYYDYNNRLIKHIEYDNDLKTIQTTREFKYIFDKNGNWTEKQIFRNGRLYKIYKQEFEYY
ncbi:SH3 domain-containing protein [Aquimarina algicola]|uniref:Uncharacterized protein n=1 Tax=Aquimarina algicola TaxID=2589995 RepID=A0A504JHD8_9FLAO|nr:SH3 domain-containing protein [Aquimarina algicola]TPN85860.1 hypothetical protein FHK87_11285 [Aquimarina algicola]